MKPREKIKYLFIAKLKKVKKDSILLAILLILMILLMLIITLTGCETIYVSDCNVEVLTAYENPAKPKEIG